MESTPNTLNRVIKQQRRDVHHMTQEQFAEMLGVNRMMVQRWEQPGDHEISVDQLIMIAEKLGITTDELLTGRKPENVNVCTATGLSSETVDRLKARDTFEDSYIKLIIEPLLQPSTIEKIGKLIAQAAYLTGEYDIENNYYDSGDELEPYIPDDDYGEERKYLVYGLTSSVNQRITKIVRDAINNLAKADDDSIIGIVKGYRAYFDFMGIDEKGSANHGSSTVQG